MSDRAGDVTDNGEAAAAPAALLLRCLDGFRAGAVSVGAAAPSGVASAR